MKKVLFIICCLIGIQNSYAQQNIAGGGENRGVWISCFHSCLPIPVSECKMGTITNSDIDFEDNKFVISIDLAQFDEEVGNFFKNNSSFQNTTQASFSISDELKQKSGKDELIMEVKEYPIGISEDKSKGYIYIQ